jgi:hypothetical protein
MGPMELLAVAPAEMRNEPDADTQSLHSHSMRIGAIEAVTADSQELARLCRSRATRTRWPTTAPPCFFGAPPMPEHDAIEAGQRLRAEGFQVLVGQALAGRDRRHRRLTTVTLIQDALSLPQPSAGGRGAWRASLLPRGVHPAMRGGRAGKSRWEMRAGAVAQLPERAPPQRMNRRPCQYFAGGAFEFSTGRDHAP